MKTSKKTWFVLACLVALTASGAIFWRPLAVAYHKKLMVAAFSRVAAGGASQSDDIDVFERHQSALRSLGYFERHVFPVTHIGPGTRQWRALYRALNTAIPDVAEGYFEMSGHTPGSLREVVVWLRPGQYARLQRLIYSFDVPPQRQEAPATQACVVVLG